MDRQKLILIFGGAWLSAALLTWLFWNTTKAPKTDKTVKVVAAAHDLPAGTRLKKADIKQVTVPEKDLPKMAMLDANAAVDRVLLFPVNANEVIAGSRVAGAGSAEGIAAAIDPGKRAISVPFTDVTGVAGLIQPRSRVDVLFTRPGSIAEAATTTVVEDVTVLAIGRNTEVASTVPAAAAGGTAPAVTSTAANTTQRAATLLVTPEQARKLEWAKNQGKIGLALRNPLDRNTIESRQPTTALDMDLAGMVRGRRGMNLGDKAWAQLTGQDEVPPKRPVVEKKEPPKPRYVVDVYRGDKHVQEIFQ